MTHASQQLIANCMRKFFASSAQESARTPCQHFQFFLCPLILWFCLGSSLYLYIFTVIICNNSRLADMGEDGAGSDDYDPNADPKADPRERRRIRYEYRELIAETQSKVQINAIYVPS